MRRWQYFILTIMLANCVEPFTPNVVSSSNSLLVVEGVIQNNMTLKLSRTSGLGENAVLPETGASVWVENSNHVKMSLVETAAGKYTGTLALSSNETYRLGITTASGTYYSDFVPVNDAAPIQDVVWRMKDDGSVQFYVSTTDAVERSRYFRWNFTETWEFYSQYESALKYENHALAIRPPEEKLNHCYKSAESTAVLIGSTQTLSENSIKDFQIQNIDLLTSAKLDVRYSVLVRQYSLTKEAFQFWQILQKNTENLGTLFGPQPSQLKSNIHNVNDPNEPVIGFISAGGVSEMRIFIGREELPPAPRLNRYPTCKLDTVDVDPLKIDATFANGVYIPVTSVGVYTPTGYMYSSAECIDCRLDGGTFSKPDFWKD